MPTIDFFLSGGLANVDGNQSLGGLPSNQLYLPGTNTLFAQVTSDEAQNGGEVYRCIYGSANSTADLTNCSVSVLQNTEFSSVSIGFELADDVQIIEFAGTPTGGTFTLKYLALVNDVTVVQETYPITYSTLATTAADIQTALNDLTYLSTTLVEGQAPSLFQVTFAGEDGHRSQILLEVTNFAVIGSSGATVSQLTAGSPKNAIATNIGFENQTPFGITFSLGSTGLGTLRPGDVFPIWLRRSTLAGTIASSSFIDSAQVVADFVGPI